MLTRTYFASTRAADTKCGRAVAEEQGIRTTSRLKVWVVQPH